MRLPLATDISSRDGTLAKDSLMKNAFAEKVGEEFDVFKRPGIATAFELGANQGQGLVSWKGTLFSVNGDSLTQGPTATLVSDGTLWTQTSASVPIIGNEAWYFVHGGEAYSLMMNSAATVLMLIKTADGVTWTTVAATIPTLPISSIYDYSIASHLGDIYCLVDTNTASVTDVYKSTDNGVTWSLATAAPGFSAGFGSTLVSDGTYLYKMGGYSGSYNGDVWRSADGIAWVLRKAAAFSGRRYLGSAYFDSKIWAMGGQDGSTSFNDVYYSSDGGANWTQATAAAAWSIRMPRSNVFAYNNKLWLIGRRNSSSAEAAFNSADGATWTQVLANIGGACDFAGVVAPSGTNKIIAFDFISNTSGTTRTATNNATGGFSFALTGAASLPISFSQTSGAASTEYLFLKTTGKAWVLTFGQPGTLTQVTDVDYPAETVPGAAYLDGYFFVMTTAGEIYNSALEVPTSWGALDFITAEIEPDDAVAIAKHMNYVVAFKSTTTELLYDAANASGSPLARLSNAAIQVGCANGYSIAALDAGLFFMSKFRSNQKSVHYFPKDGLQPVEIASPSIKRILTKANISTVHCFACQLSGHSFYVVTLPTEGLTLAYDLTTQTWAQWTFLTAAAADSVTSLTQSGGIATATATAHGFADGDPVTIAGATPSGYNGDVNIKYVDANTFTYPVSSALSSTATGTITATGWTEGYFPFGFYTNALSKDYIQHETSGKIYEISSDYGDDAGAPIDVTIRTPPLNQRSIERKNMSRLAVVGDNTTGTLLVRYSDDDYVTFSKYRQIDLSTTNKQVRRLGDYRERALDFRYTGDNKIRIRSIDIE